MTRIEKLYNLAVQFTSLGWTDKYLIGVNLGITDEMDYGMDSIILENVVFMEAVKHNKINELQKEIDYFWDIQQYGGSD